MLKRTQTPIKKERDKMKNKLFKCNLRSTSLRIVNLPSEIWKDLLNWNLNDELVFCVEEVHEQDKDGIISSGIRIVRKKDYSDEDRTDFICASYIEEI